MLMFPGYAQNNAKKKKKKKWLLEGNKNIDSTKHFLGTKDANPLIFKTNSTERMRITSGGYIGIGTPAPTFPVDINTTARIKNITTDFVHISKGLVVGDLHFCRGNSCTVDTVHTTQQRDLLLKSNNLLGLIADTVRVENPVGNSTQLKVAGSVSARDVYINSNKITAGSILMLDSSNQVVGANLKFAPGGGGVGKQCSYKNYTLIWIEPKVIPAGYPVNSIAKYPVGGNVGIGVCMPEAKLHINNIENSPYSLLVYKDSTVNFSVTRDSKVGIGTRVPQADLHIAKNISRLALGSKKELEFISSYDPSNISYNSINSSYPLRINPDPNSSQFVWFGFSGHDVDVGVSGKVGIKTLTPQADLHVAGNNPQVQIGDNSALMLSTHYIQTSGQDLLIGTSGTNIHIAGYNIQVSGVLQSNYIEGINNDTLRIGYYGNGDIKIGNPVGNTYIYLYSKVGIGTSPDPQYSLSVCGKIHAEEVKVETPGWCDFVFEPDYELMSWDSLMQYIKEHKHLPGVPGEKEVETAGVPVGEMSKILLQKIEELVLYNNELRKRVKELEEKVEKLEKERNSDVKN